MSARAMWKAELAIGEARLPVKLYAAVQDRSVHFRLLHATDLAPVQQQMINPARGEAVSREDVQRGVEVDEGLFAIIRDHEREALAPSPSRAMVVAQVLRRPTLDLRWFDRPYYLGPDGDDEGYFALAHALENGGRVAIVTWVLRNKCYQGALQGRDGCLRLQTLRPAAEMVALEHIERPADIAASDKELALARQLIATLEGPFEPEQFADRHRQRLHELIAAKDAGEPVPAAVERAPAPSRDLVAQLQASLAS